MSGTALWHHPGHLVPIRYVMVRDVAGGLRPQAFLCTDLKVDPVDILRWYVRRWSIEVTFAEVRRHLGVESQRQWSDPAIARTTPALLGLYVQNGIMRSLAGFGWAGRRFVSRLRGFSARSCA